MAGSRQTRGYFIAGALFLLVLLIAIVKSDYIIQNTLSKTGALPVKAVKIDGVFRQITRKGIAKSMGSSGCCKEKNARYYRTICN